MLRHASQVLAGPNFRRRHQLPSGPGPVGPDRLCDLPDAPAGTRLGLHCAPPVRPPPSDQAVAELISYDFTPCSSPLARARVTLCLVGVDGAGIALGRYFPFGLPPGGPTTNQPQRMRALDVYALRLGQYVEQSSSYRQSIKPGRRKQNHTFTNCVGLSATLEAHNTIVPLYSGADARHKFLPLKSVSGACAAILQERPQPPSLLASEAARGLRILCPRIIVYWVRERPAHTV